MGKPRHGKPDPFGHGGRYSTTSELADAIELSAAVQRFVEAYVIKTKRERVLTKLLGPKRGDTLRGLIAVVDPSYQTELEGSTATMKTVNTIVVANTRPSKFPALIAWVDYLR